MKKKVLSLILASVMVAGLSACGSATAEAPAPAEEAAEEAEAVEEEAEEAAEEETEAVEDEAEAVEEEAGAAEEEAADESSDLSGDVPEVTTIRWARGASGNAMVTVAKKLGYFDEVGLTVDEIPIDNNNDAFTALATDQVDILSNYGTNQPLQHIATGEDVVIFGGHMITGCMPVIAKAGTEWNGVEDLIGKKVAGPATTYAVSGPLLDMGYDPLNDVQWLDYSSQSDRVAAVASGEADYGIIGTNQNFAVNNNPDLEVMCYLSDITPNYSCCRMETDSQFINDNPIALKLLMKAMLRAQSYYEKNKEEVVTWMAEELETEEDFVAAYMLNEHYRINIDPAKSATHRAWDYMDAMGFLDENAKEIDLDDHINTEIYKAALAEATEEYGDEDPEFYEKMNALFEEQNS